MNLLLPATARPWRAGLSCLRLNLRSSRVSPLPRLSFDSESPFHPPGTRDARMACTVNSSISTTVYPSFLGPGSTITPTLASSSCMAWSTRSLLACAWCSLRALMSRGRNSTGERQALHPLALRPPPCSLSPPPFHSLPTRSMGLLLHPHLLLRRAAFPTGGQRARLLPLQLRLRSLWLLDRRPP